jgi:hypothetical protein
MQRGLILRPKASKPEKSLLLHALSYVYRTGVVLDRGEKLRMSAAHRDRTWVGSRSAGPAGHRRANHYVRTTGAQSLFPPRRLCLPGKSTSGWTTRWKVLADAALGLRFAVVGSYHVARECVVARKRLFLDAQCAAHLLLARVVDRVLVPGQVVGPREDGVAGLAGRGVDALALVRPRLRVPFEQSR